MGTGKGSASLAVCHRLHKGRLNGIIPETICGDIMSFVIGLSVASLALYALHCLGAFDKIGQWKKSRRENKRWYNFRVLPIPIV